MIDCVNRSVLVVDDDPEFRALVARLLAASGLTVVGEADSISAALSAADRLKPSGVLVDAELPDGDGIRLARGSEESLASRDRDTRGVRVCGQGDREPVDGSVRGLRILCAARLGPVHRPVANSRARLPRTRVRGRRVHHARNTVLPQPVARRRGDGGRRLRHALLGRV